MINYVNESAMMSFRVKDCKCFDRSIHNARLFSLALPGGCVIFQGMFGLIPEGS